MRNSFLDQLEYRLCLASVSGYVYNDLNGNGLHEAGESALPLTGITAYLDLNNNAQLDEGEPNQQTSARGGKYEFGQLTAGTYLVRLKLTDRFKQTDPAEGGRSVAVGGDTNALVDPFGVLVRSRIAGLVYADVNHNGARDTGENSLLAGQTVYLDINNNSALDDGEPRFITNLDGFFFNVDPGTYKVRLNVKPGWTQSQPIENGGYTVTVPSPTATGNPELLYFGTYETPILKGIIKGSVWNDLDGDGSRDTGELPVAGAIVYLDLDRNGQRNPDVEPAVLTSADGIYTFAEVNAGEYLVRQQLPDGWKQTFPLENTGHLVNVVGGQTITDKAFGRKKIEPVVGRIYGVYFVDTNGNAKLDDGETRLASKKIFLDSNENNTFDDGEVSVLTNAGGEYVFTGLTAGNYHIRAVLPAGFKQTTPLANISLASGQTIIGVLIGIKSIETIQLGSISGLSWSDLNADGIRQSTEPVQVGKTIYIDANKNGIFDSGEKSTLTNSEGRYKFINLQPGNYRIRRVVPAGYRLTVPTIGYYDITLGTGQNIVEKNFATTERAAITGQVFRDLNGDRKFNDGEIGLGGWTVYIDKNKNGKLDDGERKTTTAASGEWVFKDLFAGNYRIRVVQKEGYQMTLPELKYYDFTLSSGQVKTGLLFGEKPISTTV